jgi:hypothetical protein
VFHKLEVIKFCILCIYVDDGIITGCERKMLEAIEGKLIQDFLGCKIGSDGLVLNIKQTRIIKKFDNEVASKGEWNTPSALGFYVIRPKGNDKLIEEGKQKWFRSMIGTLLLSYPNIAIAVRELSKVVDGAVLAHEKDITRLLTYVFQTKTQQLNITSDTSDDWKIEGYNDLDFAEDKNDRKIITGFVMFLYCFPIS